MTQTVIGLTTALDQAELVVDRLKLAGFGSNDISVLLPDREGTQDFAHKNTTKAPEGTVAGGATGGVIGGALGWLAGIGALAIPGLGAFVAAGPIMAALSGAAVGATVGGAAGALIGLGIPEYEAKMYEGKIREGNILIAAHSDNKEMLKAAEDVFKDLGAKDVHRTSQAKVEKK
ncbi:MAG TPA: hypothetical protein V6C76_17845 [Drouetiella sp.]